jgi:hypothetical protein
MKSTCHCGGVELLIKIPNGLKELRRCNCSICRKKGTVVTSVAIENLTVVKVEKILTEYTFYTHTAKHYFCSRCSIYTHHKRRSNPNQYGVNIACIEGINIEDFLHIGYVEGRGFFGDEG